MDKRYFILLFLVLFFPGCEGIIYKNYSKDNSLFKLNMPIVEKGKIAVLNATNHDIDMRVAELLSANLQKMSKFAVINQKIIEQKIVKYPLNFNILNRKDEILFKNLIQKLKYVQRKLDAEYLLIFWHESFNVERSVVSRGFMFSSGAMGSSTSVYLHMTLKYNAILMKYPESVVAGEVKSHSYERFKTNGCFAVESYDSRYHAENLGALDFFGNISKDIVNSMLKRIRVNDEEGGK